MEQEQEQEQEQELEQGLEQGLEQELELEQGQEQGLEQELEQGLEQELEQEQEQEQERMRTAERIGEVVVVLGTDHHLVGTLEGSHVDELGVTWIHMGADTQQWGDDNEAGPTEGVSRVGAQEIPQTAIKAWATATDRWPDYKHGGRR